MLTCTRYLNPSISDILNLYGLTDKSLSPRQDKYNDSIKLQLYMCTRTCVHSYMHTCTCTRVHVHLYMCTLYMHNKSWNGYPIIHELNIWYQGTRLMFAHVQ